MRGLELMPSLSTRLPAALIEQARSIWLALPIEAQHQLSAHHRQVIAAGGWRVEDEIDGLEVKTWQAKSRTTQEGSVLIEVALRVGLSAMGKGWELPSLERGGAVFNLSLHEAELEQLQNLQIDEGQIKRGRKPGKGAAAMGCIALGLQLIAERYEVTQ